jgi:hypothetical protein
MSAESCSPGGEFAHRREVPEAWPGLLSAAQSLIDQSPAGIESPHILPENIAAMHTALEGLDNEDFEANRYYSLGVALCHFARQLNDPDVYKRIVTDAVDELRFRADQEGDPYKPGMQVSRIGKYSHEANPWATIAHTSARDLPPAQRLLAESLGAAQAIRDPGIKKSTDEILRTQAEGFSFVASSLEVNIDAGTSMVLRRALMVRAPEGAENVTVNECIDPEQLDGLQKKLRKPAVTLARTRIDEVNHLETGKAHPIHDAEGVDKDGDWTFDREYLETPPTENAGLLHQTRLECPAIQVPGLIQLAGTCTAEIVRAADQEFADSYHKTGGIRPERYVDPMDYDYLE